MSLDEKILPLPIRLLSALGELTHQLQIERGYTALYIDSDGEIFSDELRDQYVITDQAISVLQDLADNTSDTQISMWEKKLDFVADNNEMLILHRKDVQLAKIEFATAVNAYTYKFIYPTLDINIEIALGIEGVNPKKVSAYSNFLQWKERTGRERAWGSHGFCSKVFKNREFTERMLSLIEEQSAYQRAFMSLATKRQRHEVETSLGGYVMEVLDSIHAQLKDVNRTKDLEALSPITWFELLTGKIDRMRSAETELVQGLSLGGLPSVPVNSKAEIPLKLEQHMPLIHTLPVFSKLSQQDINELLKHADIRNYKKGKLLFMQGETLSRYYLILEGWVKLYKSTDAGDEAVLQMLSAGDSLMEAAVFLNVPTLVSAQVVQDAKLLSLPAPIIRQSLADNKNLALNMIGGLSMRSQGLIRQIEHSRLKTATERVGWFLLKLGIEQNGGKANAITLPYDKSTIASYLDMTPETFSRTLKRFKNKGFRIQNDKIIKPDPKALCSFCDEALSEACKYKDQEL
ncbi:MAG: nitrate- and nitrite sensing domain-containing protein, partial [Robiginitomaculum sp.]|nr:nitrate- and nitrite sensing domain-containing protein [Robiginitomaculum sp.]